MAAAYVIQGGKHIRLGTLVIGSWWYGALRTWTRWGLTRKECGEVPTPAPQPAAQPQSQPQSQPAPQPAPQPQPQSTPQAPLPGIQKKTNIARNQAKQHKHKA